MIFERNLGNADKIVRLIFSVVVIVLFLSGVIGGPLAAALLVLAFVLVLTVVFSFCPFYRALGIRNTEESKTKNSYEKETDGGQ